MGRNQFKKVRSRPLKKSEAEEVRQGKGVPFRRALHTFGTPCTLRCTPFSIEVCRRFLLFSLVYEPFPMLSRLPARHAHLFSNDLYIREGIYIFSYIRLIKWCAWCAVPLNPLINQDLSCTLWPKMVCRIVCMVCRVVCTNDGTHK